MSITTLVLAGAAMLLPIGWREALALGMILALSSTAIVMQNLRERGISETSSGTQSFGVLLFQDIAVIPMIALLPLLAHLPAGGGEGGHGGAATWIDSVTGWSKGLVIVGAIALVVVIGRFLLTPWLRWVASLKVTEALTATALTLVVGVALLMNAVGLSPALGTFVAGVMLASSEFRHELESDIEPFKALLLAELGHESDHAKDAARRFKEHEMEAIACTAPHRDDEQRFMGLAQQNLTDLDSLLLNARLPVGGRERKG